MKLSDLNKADFQISRLEPPSADHVQAAAKRVIASWPDIAPVAAEKDRQKLARNVADRLEEDDWQDARLAEVVRAAAAIFDNDFRGRTEFKHLVDFYCDETRVSTRGAFLSALATIYIRTFVPDTMRTKRLAEALRSARRRIGPKWTPLLEAAPRTLDADRAPGAIAELMINMEDPWNALKELGIASPHGKGLMEHAHLAYLRQQGPRMHDPAVIDHVLTWLKPRGARPWLAVAARSIDALLKPWTERPCPAEIKTRLTTALFDIYGDPRDSTAACWASISHDQSEMLLGWLAETDA